MITARGIALDRDDILRRAVIMSLMCHFEVSKESIETVHMIKFDEYFKTEIAELKLFEDEGLVENTPEWISVTPKGKLLVRAVAMTFDRYLRADQRARRYSKIV
jgi:oxygen-independent coproporphyrinogen-3 oxidase